MGYEEALDEWDRRHAQPLVAQAIPGNVKETLREMKEVLADLVDVRPAAGLKAVQEVEEWAKAVGAGRWVPSTPRQVDRAAVAPTDVDSDSDA